MGIILQNARIIDIKSRSPAHRDLKIENGRVAAVLPSFSTKGENIKDMEGSLLLKPFCDYHLHIPGAELYNLFGVNLSSCITIYDYADVLQGRLSSIDGIVRGFGWNMAEVTSALKPDEYLSFLDEICSNRPIILFSNDFHSCWCNSMAIDMIQQLNIGYLYTEPDNACIFHGNIAKNIFAEQSLSFTNFEIKQSVLSYQDRLLSYGMSEVYSFMFIGTSRSSMLRALSDLEEEKQLVVRVICCYDIYPGQTKDEIVAQIEEARIYQSEKIRFCAAKIYLDGVIDNYSAWLKESYSDRDYKGSCFWSLDSLEDVIRFLRTMDISIHAHAIGDAASEAIMDILMKVDKVSKRDVITHLQLCSTDCIAAMVANDVVACFQPFWIGDGSIESGIDRQRLGDRSLLEYPVKEFFSRGATVLFSSDNPVTENFAPLLGIAYAYKAIAEESLFIDYLNAYTAGVYDGQTCQIEIGDEANFLSFSVEDTSALLGMPTSFVWKRF